MCLGLLSVSARGSSTLTTLSLEPNGSAGMQMTAATSQKVQARAETENTENLLVIDTDPRDKIIYIDKYESKGEFSECELEFTTTAISKARPGFLPTKGDEYTLTIKGMPQNAVITKIVGHFRFEDYTQSTVIAKIGEKEIANFSYGGWLNDNLDEFPDYFWLSDPTKAELPLLEGADSKCTDNITIHQTNIGEGHAGCIGFEIYYTLEPEPAIATNTKIYMNTTSKTMTLTNKATGETVDVGEPDKKNTYTFDAPAGTYVLTAYATNKDGETVINGTIELNVTEDEGQEFKVLTCTAYATNKVDNVLWTVDEDYTVEVEVNSREGEKMNITLGNSTTAGRKTFLALNGNSYYTSLIPNEAHQAEGYMTLFKSGTLTFAVTVSGAIPMGKDYTVTLPADANLTLGTKTAHFIKFREVEPKATETEGDMKKVTYCLAENQVYNYRTWKSGGLTQAGYFTMYLDEEKLPVLSFTAADYEAFGAKTVKHDVQWNKGFETGDIFVNINERGHLKMNVGDTYEAHAMRTWQLTDNSTNNYFMEPDFHYTVIDTDGKPSTGVIEIDNADTTDDPWSVIKAVGKGTAIVLVTYDAIGLNFYSSANKTEYMGGEYWSAIWPENTAAYVVTVGDDETAMKPNMLINEDYNTETLKNAGEYVDAEHDVFYYLDTEEGASYSFTPEGVANVEIAYPLIGEQMATYSGFGTEGVTKNSDGSYTLLLKEGRQIVRMTDAEGNALYQVLTAKTCHREITNVTREGSTEFYPGDQVKIQYSGLRHPANKLSGIYNMSAYVTYNGNPNGTSLILSPNQYTFGSSDKAQAVTFDIPADYDAEAKPEIVLNEGVIQVNGYGDPIGAHRLISRTAGRSPNFTAIAHKTYFGAIPEVRIPVTLPLSVATLEDIELAENSHKPQFTAEDEEAEGFQSGDFWFDMNVMSDYDTWWGYGVANHTATNFVTLDAQFNSCTGKGADDSANYGVAYVGDFMGPVYVTLTTNGLMEVPGIQVTNAAYSFVSMTNGDSFAKKFGAGDWFKLTATGYDDNGDITGTKDFYLADCRSADSNDWYILNNWAYMSLSTLGAVRQIRFTLSSSDTGAYGMNTPAYFCYDNLGAEGTETVPAGNYNDVVTAVSNISTATQTPIQHFDLQGRLLNQSQRGLNIVRMGNGRVVKVVVK